MTQNRKPTQTIQNERPAKVPASIRFGRVLLLISSVFLIFVAAFELFLFVESILQGGTEATDNLSFLEWIGTPILALFLIFCSIGGISFVLDKGPFVGLCPLCAIVSVLIVIVDFVFSTRTLIKDPNHDWMEWLISLLTTELVSGLYFTGWSLAKNWLD